MIYSIILNNRNYIYIIYLIMEKYLFLILLFFQIIAGAVILAALGVGKPLSGDLPGKKRSWNGSRIPFGKPCRRRQHTPGSPGPKTGFHEQDICRRAIHTPDHHPSGYYKPSCNHYNSSHTKPAS